jgi:phosphoribosylformimino-5-aminoimidazole carboxamide ribonucleotide (ProFAR) isomerase
VSFQVIPAIDVAGGRLARVSAAGIAPLDAFGGDPLAAAAAFAEAGSPRLHVVDVDLATTGRAANLDTLRSVAALGVPVQASGGVASAAHVDELLGAGADRVVLGSAALADRGVAERLIAAHGERLCVGIEADGPAIRPRGGGSELVLWETLVWLGGLDVRRYLFTEVRRVGELAGPDLDGIWALATHVARPVLAAGGIRSVDDLRAVAGLGGDVEGAIVGRALHEGLDLREALRVTG